MWIIEIIVCPNSEPPETETAVGGQYETVEDNLLVELELNILVCRSPYLLECYQQSRSK